MRIGKAALPIHPQDWSPRTTTAEKWIVPSQFRKQEESSPCHCPPFPAARPASWISNAAVEKRLEKDTCGNTMNLTG